jgi:hypothetical protein
LDALLTAIGCAGRPELYFPWSVITIALGAVDIFRRRRGYDRFFAWHQLVTIVAWSLLVRRFLLQAGLM